MSEEIDEERVFWVRWNAAARDARPDIEAAIARFDPGPLPAAQAAAEWLREHGLGGESQPYLALVDDEVAGFYALTVGAVELSQGARKKHGLVRGTQGAILVTWIAKSAQHALDGKILVRDAVGVAQETATAVAATVFALDPFDAPTAEMWKARFKMKPSGTRVPGSHDDPPLKRLFLPLRDLSID